MQTFTHDTWKLWFNSLLKNEEGNRNMEAFMAAMDANKNEAKKLKNLTDNQNNVFLLVDGKWQPVDQDFSLLQEKQRSVAPPIKQGTLNFLHILCPIFHPLRQEIYK